MGAGRDDGLKNPVTGQASGDNVRRISIENQLDLVLQHQLAALQAGDFQLVGQWVRGKGADLLIQPPMLCLHGIELFPDCVVHSLLGFPSRTLVGRDEPRLQSGGRTFWVRDKPSEKCFTDDAVQTHSRKGMAPMDKAHVEELTSQHATLAAQIDE